MSRTKDTLAAVVCPVCGNDGSRGQGLRYVEDIQVWRTVHGPKDGALQIDSKYDTGAGYDDGENPRFECLGDHGPHARCGHTWPVPDWLLPLIDWI